MTGCVCPVSGRTRFEKRKKSSWVEAPNSYEFQSKWVADSETSIPVYFPSPRNIGQGANGLGIRIGR